MENDIVSKQPIGLKLQIHFAFKRNFISKSFSHPQIIIFLLCVTLLSNCTKRQRTEPTPQMDARAEFWIRVLLFKDVKESKLRIGSFFTVSQQQPRMSEERFGPIDSPIKVRISAGKVAIGGKVFYGKELTIVPDSPYIFNLNGSNYRGKLKFLVKSNSNSFDAINYVPLEPYLAGVTGAEMPDYWEPAALEAQTIAARTYCLYIKRRFGADRSWDVTKTQANQVYRGVSVESPQIWAAVNKTKGKVLVCRHSDGRKDIFPAYYSSTCGGHTENSQNVFGGQAFEPLSGVGCPYCQYVARGGSFFWSKVELDKSEISKKLIARYPVLKKLGEIKDIVPVRQSDYQIRTGKEQSTICRLTFVKLVGTTGEFDYIRAEDFRVTIDSSGNRVRSTIFKITHLGDKWAFWGGRGWGHGVGMCQCGAQGMARREGKSAYEILSYYYPSSEIEYVY